MGRCLRLLHRLMVGQRTLTPLILVRIQVKQPTSKMHGREYAFCRFFILKICFYFFLPTSWQLCHSSILVTVWWKFVYGFLPYRLSFEGFFCEL